MPSIFINYRVVDLPYGAAAIDLALAERFGRDRVFRDCRSMEMGDDYPKEMQLALRDADALLVVVGPDWLTLRDDGTRLIDRERDWVRWEIEQALDHDKHVIPLLLQDVHTMTGTRHATAPTVTDLPPSIRGLAHKQRHTLSHRRLEADLKALIDRLVDLVPGLVVADLFESSVPPLDAPHAPGALLAPEHEVVPFTGRDEQLADLRSWATSEAAASVMLVSGPSGVGKKRLARALCDELLAAGWLAGSVPTTAPGTLIGRTAEVDRPVLAVVDGAESRPEQVGAFVEAFVERSPVRDRPARLLLLSRSRGRWATDLAKTLRIQARDLLLRARSYELPLSVGAEAGQQVRAARGALAARCGLPVSTGPLSLAGGSLLDLHAETLGELISSPRPATTADPVDRVLQADRRHWRRLVRASGQSHLTTAGLAEVATMATLCRPASAGEADALRARLPLMLEVSPDRISEYVDWLGKLYPAPYGPAAVRPNALGERLVAATLAIEPSLATNLAAHGTPQQLVNALTVLGHAMPSYPDLATAVTAMVQQHPQGLVVLGADVAARLAQPEPFARALGAGMNSENFTDFGGIVDLLEKLGRGDPGLNPLRAESMRVWQRAAERLVDTVGPPDDAADPLTAPVRRLGSMLADFVGDAFAGVMDPSSGRMPTQADGKPLVPSPLVDVLRTMIDRGWFRSGSAD